jgi:hypothetical protein
MYLIRNRFTAKPGMASKLAATLRDAMTNAPFKVRILTDVVGEFNTVEMEHEVPSLAEFEQRMKEYSEGAMGKDVAEKMKAYTDMYVTGHREILRVM